MFVLRFQYQYKRLTGHCCFRNGETCVAWHVTRIHSVIHPMSFIVVILSMTICNNNFTIAISTVPGTTGYTVSIYHPNFSGDGSTHIHMAPDH